MKDGFPARMFGALSLFVFSACGKGKGSDSQTPPVKPLTPSQLKTLKSFSAAVHKRQNFIDHYLSTNKEICPTESNSPVSRAVFPETGYFYILESASSCPVKMQNRRGVLRRTPGQGLIARMTVKETLGGTGRQFEDVSDVASYGVEGEFRLDQVSSGVALSGDVAGSFVSKLFQAVGYALSVSGLLSSSGDSTYEIRASFQFPDFIAEGLYRLQKGRNGESGHYYLNGEEFSANDFFSFMEFYFLPEGMNSFSFGF